MAIFDKAFDVVTGGGGEGFLGKLTGGFDLGGIGDALKGALSGDFSGLMDVGIDFLATSTLGPVFGPMAADVVKQLMDGGELDMSTIGSLLTSSGLTEGSDLFKVAGSVLQGISGGQFTEEQGLNLLSGLASESPELQGLVQNISENGLQGVLQGLMSKVGGDLLGGIGGGLFRS